MRTIKILHGSDFHNTIPNIPVGDFDYFIQTGDLCPHFKKNWSFTTGSRKVDIVAEASDQEKWFKEIYLPATYNIAKERIEINGNHCFLNIEKLVENSLYKGSKTIIVDGVKFGLMTGVLEIDGTWHDEITEYEFHQRILALDRDIDILVTHTPPRNVLDMGWTQERFGSSSLYSAIFGISGTETYFTRLKLCVFGHIHEAPGLVEHEVDGRKIMFSNAAGIVRVIEMEI